MRSTGTVRSDDRGVLRRHDAIDEFLVVTGGVTANGLLGDEAEPTLNLIEPRRIGRGVVDVATRPGGAPSTNFEVLVDGPAIYDEMPARGWPGRSHRGVAGWRRTADGGARAFTVDDLAALPIEGGKQRGRTMAQVVMRDASPAAQAHRQDRPLALQGLNPAILINAEDQRLVRRVKVARVECPPACQGASGAMHCRMCRNYSINRK